MGSVDSGYYSADTNESFNHQITNENKTFGLKQKNCAISAEEDLNSNSNQNTILRASDESNQNAHFYETFDELFPQSTSNNTILTNEAALQYLSILKQQKNNTQVYININGKYVSVGEIPLLFLSLNLRFLWKLKLVHCHPVRNL